MYLSVSGNSAGNTVTTFGQKVDLLVRSPEDSFPYDIIQSLRTQSHGFDKYSYFYFQKGF